MPELRSPEIVKQFVAVLFLVDAEADKLPTRAFQTAGADDLRSSDGALGGAARTVVEVVDSGCLAAADRDFRFDRVGVCWVDELRLRPAVARSGEAVV
jgi:hypothetical protein